MEESVIAEGRGTVERVEIVEAIARVREPATGPRIVEEVAETGLEIEVYRLDQTAVLRETRSAAQAALLAAHARAVREAHRA